MQTEAYSEIQGNVEVMACQTYDLDFEKRPCSPGGVRP